MSAFADNAHEAYEVGIYNRSVRTLVKQNRSHALFDDKWADVQIQEIRAATAEDARTAMTRIFPTEDGFVIDHVARRAHRAI